MRWTKTKIIVLIIFLLVVAIPSIVFAVIEANDHVRITALDYHAVVSDEPAGTKVTVTERITFDIKAASKENLFWELWRDLPEEWENGVRTVSYKVLSVKRLTVDGRPAELEFTQAKKLYWDDSDYISTQTGLGPNKWYHSEGPYDNERYFECVLIYVDGLYRETTVFEIEYEIYGAAMKYADSSELYLPMYSGKTIKYLNDFKAQILMPEDKMPSEGNYNAWTYGTNLHEIPFAKSDMTEGGKRYRAFSFGLDKSQLKFKPYNRYIEFSLVAYGQDKFKFTQNVEKKNTFNDVNYSDVKKAQEAYEKLPGKYLMVKLVVLILFLGISALIIWIIFVVDKSLRKKHKFSKPAVDYDFYREIPGPLDANFAGALVFCKHKISDDVPGGYSAAMLGLVRKNYIEVERINPKKGWVADNTKIVIASRQPFNELSALKPLTQTEDSYYKLLVRHARSGQISLTDFQNRVSMDSEYTDMFAKNVRASVKTTGVSKEYFKEREYKRLKSSARGGVITLIVLGVVAALANLIAFQTRLDLAFGAFFALAAAFIAGAIILSRLSKSYVLLTQLGEDEYSKWRGLYNFLNSETLMKERTVPEVAIWEDYLLYATAFGISEKVIKALNVRFPEFNMTNSLIIRHPFLSAMVFTHMYSRAFRGATRRASFSHRTGGMFGGGGGYSSGGRGGGGGGGGH